MTKILNYLQQYFQKGSGSWHDYEKAKEWIRDNLFNDCDYDQAIKLVIDYIGV